MRLVSTLEPSQSLRERRNIEEEEEDDEKS
jgi:hypothetical protein